MKKVCVITTVHNDLDARIFYRECLSLVKKYRVDYIVPNAESRLYKGINIMTVNIPKNPLTRSLFGYRFFITAKRAKADIYHFHDFDFVPWAWLLGKVTKKPVIYDSHEFFEYVIENRSWAKGFIGPLVLFLISITEKMFVSSFDGVFVAAPAQKKNVYKDAVILLNKPPQSSYPKYYSNKNYKKIIYIGSVTKDRAVDKVDEIKEELGSKYEISLAGNVVHKPYRDDINLLGFINNNELAENVADFGIGLVPFNDKKQYHYSIPSKVFDYLAMGMLVIAPEFTREGFGNMDLSEHIFYVDGSPKSFAKKIKDLNKDKAFMEKGSLDNRKAFLDKYSWENEEIKMLKLYKELLGE